MIKLEVSQYYRGKAVPTLERGDLLSILIYALVQTGVEDLAAQLLLIQNFIPDKVRDGFSQTSSAFCDFKNAIEFLTSLDNSQLI